MASSFTSEGCQYCLELRCTCQSVVWKILEVQLWEFLLSYRETRQFHTFSRCYAGIMLKPAMASQVQTKHSIAAAYETRVCDLGTHR